jgi:hypothetical protein
MNNSSSMSSSTRSINTNTQIKEAKISNEDTVIQNTVLPWNSSYLNGTTENVRATSSSSNKQQQQQAAAAAAAGKERRERATRP